MRKRERKESSSFSLRSTEFRPSEFFGPRMEVHLLDESYVWVPKSHNFVEDSSEEFGKSKVSGLRNCRRDFLDFLLCFKR